MEGTYPILLGGNTVGQVRARQEGLYTRFCCRCRLTGEIVYRVIAVWDGGEESLGICVPMGEEFGLDTRIPSKRFGAQETVRFQAAPSRSERTGRFVPLSPEEPFAYISRLQEAFLAKKGDQTGIILPD